MYIRMMYSMLAWVFRRFCLDPNRGHPWLTAGSNPALLLSQQTSKNFTIRPHPFSSRLKESHIHLMCSLNFLIGQADEFFFILPLGCTVHLGRHFPLFKADECNIAMQIYLSENIFERYSSCQQTPLPIFSNLMVFGERCWSAGWYIRASVGEEKDPKDHTRAGAASSPPRIQ